MRTISFSVTDAQYDLFRIDGECKGQTVSQYCKTAAFSHLSKYGSKGVFAEIVKLLKDGKRMAPDPTDVGSERKSQAGH